MDLKNRNLIEVYNNTEYMLTITSAPNNSVVTVIQQDSYQADVTLIDGDFTGRATISLENMPLLYLEIAPDFIPEQYKGAIFVSPEWGNVQYTEESNTAISLTGLKQCSAQIYNYAEYGTRLVLE